MEHCSKPYHRYISTIDNISDDASLALEYLDDNDLIGCLLQIGYAISIIGINERDTFSCSDCITTAKSLTKLFNVELTAKRFENEISGRFIMGSNYMMITYQGCNFHYFVLLEYNNDWYILCSYAERYPLMA